jgi:hypothetical protein
MFAYGEISYSIDSQLLDDVVMGGVDEGVEVICMRDAGGVTVGVRVQTPSYGEALNLVSFYAARAARHVQQDGLSVPDPYSVKLFDSRALEAHHRFTAALASDELP